MYTHAPKGKRNWYLYDHNYTHTQPIYSFRKEFISMSTYIPGITWITKKTENYWSFHSGLEEHPEAEDRNGKVDGCSKRMEFEAQYFRGDSFQKAQFRSQTPMPLNFKSGENTKNFLFSILANFQSHDPMPSQPSFLLGSVLIPSVDLTDLWALRTMDVTTDLFCIHSVNIL